jgi:hypothetical protein
VVQYASSFRGLLKMKIRYARVSLGVACVLWGAVAAASAKGDVDKQWTSLGRTADEQRFSPLTQINTDNVKKLGLAWYADFDTNRGQEATPLFIDGVIYLSTAWSKVKAYDARSGKLLWAYDPKVPGEFAGRGLPGPVRADRRRRRAVAHEMNPRIRRHLGGQASGHRDPTARPAQPQRGEVIE